MRNFIDAILTAISAASLNDEEWAMITISSQTYTKALYLEIAAVIDSRGISSALERLGFYFKARNVDIGDAPSTGKSNIYLGDDLCS